MIVIGYQGIGKTTLARDRLDIIDLESSIFQIGNKKMDNWQIPYCRLAEHLSSEGYDVMVSSHREVRDWLQYSEESVVAIVPSVELKTKWIEKLFDRYRDEPSTKNERAMLNAIDRYERNINEITEDLEHIIIQSMDYSLEEIIDEWKRKEEKDVIRVQEI